MEIELNGYYTMILATLVLMLGRWWSRSGFLSDFNIPEPVPKRAGGLLVITMWCLRSTRCSG